MRVDQIGLLLWKNYIVRKRQPGILALVFVWPVTVFMILYTIRDNVDPKYYPTCQFPARSMPQNGLLPFVQSFICSLGNPCDPLTEYEEVPSYRNATLGPLVTELQPMLNNQTILSAVKTLPHSIQLLKSMAQILTKPEIKALFDRGIRLGDLFNNHEEIKRTLREHMPNARDGLIDELFESSVKLLYLIEAFGSSNIDGVICSPESLRKYLILPREEDFEDLSKILCDIDSETMLGILENLSKHLDFTGLLEMVDRVMAKFRGYDFFVDLRRAAETILDLETSRKYIPVYLRIREWMPKIIMVFKNVTFKEIDLTFVNKTLNVLDPVFSTEKDWSIARQAFLRLQKMLEFVKGMTEDRNDGSSSDFFTLIERLTNEAQFAPFITGNIENLTQALDLGFAILQSCARLSARILDRHKDELELMFRQSSRVFQRFVTEVKKTNPEDYFCQNDTLDEMFEHFKDIGHESKYATEILCSDSGKKFISEMYGSMELNSFENNKRRFSYYCSLGIHLSIAKMTGCCGLSYNFIKPNLKSIDLLAEVIVKDLRQSPSSWVEEVRRRKSELIEVFYLTATDRDKVLKILEYDNFTKSYCMDQSPPRLLSFPKGSNETALKALVCRLSSAVQTDLELNMEAIKDRLPPSEADFNWTDFNARTIEIYRYIDTLIHQKDPDDHLAKLDKLKRDFVVSWTADLSVRDGFEISVGLICKFFSLMESPLFNIQEKTGWKNLHAIGWGSSVVSDMIEKILDETKKNNQSAVPFDVLPGMPVTYVLFSMIFHNLNDLILDVVDIITMKPVHLIFALDDYKSREEEWPCVRSESVGSAMELRLGRGVLDYMDMELDKTVAAFHSDFRASDVWKSDVFIDDRILVTSKFVSYFVHKAVNLVTDILRDTSTWTNSVVRINWLSLLGFGGTGPIAVLYNKLPFVLATLANGLTDPNKDKLTVNGLVDETDVSCPRLTKWCSSSGTGLSHQECANLEMFFCAHDPEKFNAYTDLYMSLTAVWWKPVNTYRSYLMTVINDVHQLANLVQNMTQKEVKVEVPFSKTYLIGLLQKFRSSWEDYMHREPIYVSYKWTNDRLVIEGVSEVLVHVANALNNVKVQNNRMHIWDFIESGDVRQLLKILDVHPEETIALAAQVATISANTGNLTAFEDIRKIICNNRDPLPYWSTANRKRFIQEVCSFDPYQLLKTVTSEEYSRLLTGPAPTVIELKPLSASLSKLIDSALNLTTEMPDLSIKSNIFNSTTWRNLSNETLSEIRGIGQAWVRRYSMDARNADLGQSKLGKIIGAPDAFARLVRFCQLLDATVNLMAGGDIWQKLRVIYENSKVKPVLTLVEDTPNIAVSVVDTFVKSDRLNDFVEKLAFGKAHPCDIDKYLIVPGFVRKKVLLSSITKFCQKIVLAENQLTLVDILPLDAKYEENRMLHNNSREFNETYLLERIDRMQSTFVRIMSEGFKEPKVPTWWTSFKEGTFKDFLTQYKKEMKNYKTLNVKRTRYEFMQTLEKTLHYVVDIMVDFQNETYSDRVSQCYYKFFGQPPLSRPGLHVSMVLGILDTLQNNLFILDTARNHKALDTLTKKAEKYVPIWKHLSEVVKPSDTKMIESFLPGATINVNAVSNDRNGSLCRTKLECRNATVLYDVLSSKKAGKLFRYDPKASGYPSLVEISDRLANSLDLDRIDRELKGWRMEAAWDLTWLKEILSHLSVVFAESGDLLDVASKIDFEDYSNVLGVPDIVDGVVNLLKDKTVDKLFDGDMFDNWDVVSSYLVNKVGISNDVALMLSRAKIDMISVFMKERRALSLKEIICSPKKLGEMLSFGGRITAEEVSAAICQLEDSQTQNVMVALIKNLNFDYIFKTVMSANVKNILANANLTETEGKMVLDNLGVAAELLPFFKEKLTSKMSSAEPLKSDVEKEEVEQSVSTSRFLQDSSEMLCGQAMVSDNGDLYKIISRIEDNTKEFDQAELDSLPTDFCRDTYKSFIAMGGGKIVWSYVKPLLRGQILYAPNTTVINEVMTLANKTFAEMESFGVLMDSFEKTLTSLANLSEMSDNLKDIQDMMSSDVMKIAIKSFGGGNFNGDFSDMNLSEISWQLKKSKRLIAMVGMLNDLLRCVLVDRVRGFRSEEEMEAESRILMETREFLAGVVFLDNDPSRSRRSTESELPDNVAYKIRMDVDYVQSTKRLKNQFWIPGPESSFIEHLRYLRGFVQLQDSIDRAIIRTKSGRDQEWRTMTQQMPYPCWKDVPFQTTLYESQGIQVCFFFALMMCVGAAVRHIVWERESQNAMVMSVMGLKPWRNTVAWFITTFTELMIVMISIALVLLAGKILPKSDPFLVLIMMIDYSFAIVTFCYMISTVCSSASLAAITTVVMFLLTFMPYVIVIAMEAALGLGYKLLICLSMSTSFCYGCLYAARKEVQGVGLTWSSMWEESSSGDPMTLGLILLMIAFDGCLYALIGYIIARYTNSDEESDASGLVVNEKQTGVRFEGVRKVYNTDQGEVVAVDNFTLKLCEGEVTSLLGRNGAGKTTIIKMLTGMLAPTTGEICLNGEEDCKPDIGVCPQDNVLIGTLTPREHMIFYAKLKRPKELVNMQRSVDEMLTSLELGKQEHEPVYRLSGGTKRRLCVALAFLGSPKLVILDEPGAGVDPAARRRIWRLIDQHRIGRTVILSTHHLDEADMLSDTVVVMHKGKILCTGSPLSLKMMHGRGYRLLVSYPGERDANTDSIEKTRLETLKSVIEEVVPNAVTSEVSGSEVAVTLPFQGKSGLHNNIAQAAKMLEDSRKLVGYSHFSLECDTLERVFLDLCSRAESGSSVIRASQDSVASVDHIGLSMPNDDVDLIDVDPSLNPSPIRQVKALLKKRVWHFRKDWMTFFAGLFLPTVFVAVAMGFSLIRPPSGDEPALPLTPKLYDTHPTYFYSVDNGDDSFLQHVSLQLHDRFGDDYAGAWQTLPNDTGTCECLDGQQVCHDVSQAVEGLLQVLPGRPTLDWIVSTHHEYIEKRYGGWSLSHANDNPLFVVWYNNKGHHALPSYLSALNEAILRASGVQGRLTTLNHPLRLSSDQLNRTTLLQHVADVGVALVLLIAFNLVAAQGSKELVRERLSEEKRILLLAGVHPVTYWTTALIWDFFVFGLSIGLAVIVFEIFGLPAYVARDNLAGICLLLFLFAWAAIPFSHLTEKAFDDSSLSNMVLFCTNTFIGVASLATILVLDILGKTKTAENIRNILHHILLIFPQYVLGDALVQISRNDITAQLLEKFNMDTYQSPLGWDLLGLHYIFLAVVGSVLFSLNLMIECRVIPNWNKQRCPYSVVEEDEDVSKERMRVESGMSDDILQTVKLRKEYRSVYGTNVAVQNLSIGVQAGKCFGLLGTNGAGKSSTFRMLTTEIIPTSGRIILKGKEIGVGPLCNGEVGYCPQSDGLDGFLSPHQCLTIHGEVCGLNNVPKAVESMLKRLDLLKYAHKRVSSLSGGNKRKLCTALSVMAPVSVVLMDEPTSGMDPATKDLVAKTIRCMTKNQSCVILTSHSVAECENLCNRVGILAKAGLRCIGTPQHLKHK
ncbi:ATP-binding cassette sub-family A member 13 [Dufourea novaeangliae]|uniref:ATP-binding cassette sub-family A member 13 n=1 Tax=Dufourea novaeangliae TaxID=178035 RepID=A0A154NXU8_DUFNO|nr:ATP-binding cassette sub-family A member 13 [Dufourea novaeangliae]